MIFFFGGGVWLSFGGLQKMGHTPSTAGTFQKKFQKNSGKTPETLSERFLEFPSRVRLGCPKHYNSRHLRLPERFQNSLPPSTAGDASFFRSGSGEGLSELVMEFPAVLGVFLTKGCFWRMFLDTQKRTRVKKTGTMVQKPVLLDPKTQIVGAKNGTTVQKTGTRAHSSKPPYQKTSLLLSLNSCGFASLFLPCSYVHFGRCLCNLHRESPRTS